VRATHARAIFEKGGGGGGESWPKAFIFIYEEILFDITRFRGHQNGAGILKVVISGKD